MRINLSILIFICTIGIFNLSAQMSAPRQPRRTISSLLAENSSFVKQSHALDSAISKHINEEDELPADDLYDSWGTTGVNAGRVELAEVPDSMYFDCKGYIPPIEGPITSRFGPRWKRYHYGIDIKLNVGDPVGSAFDGKVRITKYDRGGYGSYVVVRHDNGLETVYGHFSKILVTEGQSVRAGEIIGLGGNTGHSTGPHLHFETRFLGNPINPEKLFDFELGEAKLCRYFMVKSIAFDWAKPYRNNTSTSSSRKSRATGSTLYHKVRSGETLSHIAEKHGVSVSQICRLNGIGRNKILQPGQKIRYN